MKTIIYIILFSLSHNLFTIAAQNTSAISSGKPQNPYEILTEYVKGQNDYITPVLKFKELEDEYLDSPLKGIYLDYMTYLLGSVGNFGEMYKYEEKFLESLPTNKNRRKQNEVDLTVSPVDGFKKLEAVQAIEKVAEKEQVIMINEEHRTPHHRAFATQILDGLYKKGFRYLAVEALYSSGTGLNERGYPTQASGNINMSDPVFGDLIRTALKTGFKVVPYEREKTCRSSTENPFECDDQREKEQAQNIYDRILKADPKAKILVFAGRDHIAKIRTPQLTMMAKHFEEITKITPFTIDQLHLSERRNPADETPLYRFLTKQNIQTPTVFQSADGNFYAKSDVHDMFIYHPRMNLENGRPAWLKMNGRRMSKAIDPKKLKLNIKAENSAQKDPVLIQAFYANEASNSIPIDQILIFPNDEIPVLILPTGDFKIRAINKRGELIAEYTEKIQNRYFIG